jgi:hypothetical protein
MALVCVNTWLLQSSEKPAAFLNGARPVPSPHDRTRTHAQDAANEGIRWGKVRTPHTLQRAQARSRIPSTVCGPIEGDPTDPSGATITNPSLIIEVLSLPTEEEDRGNKWRRYQLLPSLQESRRIGVCPPAHGNTETRRKERFSCRVAHCWISPSCTDLLD